MRSLEVTTPRNSKSRSRWAGLIAFASLLAIGLALGLLLAVGSVHGLPVRLGRMATLRTTSIAAEIDRELRERERALTLLGQEPSAIRSFRRVYPEFDRVTVTASGSEPTRETGRIVLSASVDGRTVAGRLSPEWVRQVLVRFDDVAPTEPPFRTSLGSIPSVRAGDLVRIRPLSKAGPVLATRLPGNWIAQHKVVTALRAVAVGLFLGLFAGTAAWLSIAAATRSFRRRNEALKRQVAERTAELEAAERSFRSIFENVPLGLYECDPSGRFLRVNPTLASTLGYDSPEAMLATIGRLQELGDAAEREEFLQRVTEKGEEPEDMTLFERPDGRRLWLAERARAIRDADGRVAAIEGAILDVTAQRELETRLRRMGETDPLTGVLNRRGMSEAIALAALPVSFVTLDVDRFKEYNDTYGHPAGDRALQAVAEVVRRHVRDRDSVARVGGEEFTVVLPGTDAEGAKALAERLRRAVGDLSLDGNRITVSGGVATAFRSEDQFDALEDADRALYEAKQAGRNRIIVRRARLA